MSAFRTWHAELAVVALALSAVAVAVGGDAVQWVGVVAVSLSFAHGQVSERLAEREAARPAPDVECHRMAGRYFLAKEACWLAYFALLGAWTAIVGVVLFLLYPAWRKTWRQWRPL